MAQDGAMAVSTSQFRYFFPAWKNMLLEIMSDPEKCANQTTKYFNFDISGAYELTDCILKSMNEFQKIEMSITAILLGLLPTMLQLIGPPICDVSLLATRRPLLAFFLAIGTPSLSFNGESKYLDPITGLSAKVKLTTRPGILSKYSILSQVFISFTEYILAGAAAANVVYQAYQLAYWSVSFATIAIDTGPYISKSYGPFLWIMLLGPVHLLSLSAFWLKYGETNTGEKQKSLGRRIRNFIGGALQPCAYGRPLLLREKDDTYFHVIVAWLVNLGIVVVFIYATVALSSQAFISLGDIVPVIARFLAGTLICRAILMYELHGLREVTSIATNGETSDADSQDQPVQGQRGHRKQGATYYTTINDTLTD
jgi:hypothetical protein